MSERVSHILDFQRFAHHAKLRMDQIRYVHDVHSTFRSTIKWLEGYILTDKWFSYWPLDYVDGDKPFMEFEYVSSTPLWPRFEKHPYVVRYAAHLPADKIAQHLEIERNVEARNRVNCSLMMCHYVENKLWEIGPPPAPFAYPHVIESMDDRISGLVLHMPLELELHHEPWEEGSPGYDT